MLNCKTCGKAKPFDAFWKQNTRRGYFAECKSCSRKRNQNWINQNRARFREMTRSSTTKARRTNPVKAMINLARARSKNAGLEFTITEQDILFPTHCPVLGIELSFGLGMGEPNSLKVRDARASLDRIDNNKGYIPGNVIVVSYRANRIKSDASAGELVKIARFYAQRSKENRETQMPSM